jgi:hypothetical protein
MREKVLDVSRILTRLGQVVRNVLISEVPYGHYCIDGQAI